MSPHHYSHTDEQQKKTAALPDNTALEGGKPAEKKIKPMSSSFGLNAFAAVHSWLDVPVFPTPPLWDVPRSIFS